MLQPYNKSTVTERGDTCLGQNMRDMNDVRDIIMQWEKGFETREEEMFFYLKHGKLLHEEYWDMMPMGGSIKEHPWDHTDD